MSASKRVLVVGCGFAGATMARLLAEQVNYRVLLIDRRSHLAGNAYDYRDQNGITIHKYGSHIFHTKSRRVWQFISRFTNFNTYQHRVVAMVDGIEVPVPFNLESLRLCFPPTLADRLERQLLERFDYGVQVPVLDFMQCQDTDLRFLAQFVHDKIFRDYTSKQWGTPPEKTDAAVTARVPVRISRDSRYFTDPYQGIPSLGYTETVRRMIEHPNIELRLGTDYAEVRSEANSFSHIFYSGSIDEYFNYQLGELPYRSERIELEEYAFPYYQSRAVVNFPSDYDFTRIHEYKYYLNEQCPYTVIAKEYPEAFCRGKNERFYPIASESAEALYKAYTDLAQASPQLHFLGRLGDYRYYNMDDAIARAMQLFDELNHELMS